MKILIVDDERDICEKIARFLEFEQIEVLIAQNGLSAKRMLEHEAFAAVVTDLRMPGMDGLSLLKRIQEKELEIPVIMMSAYGDIADAVEAVKLGAQDYIVKPFDLDELIFRLRRILENQKLQDQVKLGQRKRADFQDWIGESLNMLEIKALIE